MDKHTEEYLRKIMQAIPKEWKKNLIKKGEEDLSEKEKAEYYYKKYQDPKLKEAIDKGGFDHKMPDEVNQKVAKEIEGWVAEKIREAIKDKKIQDPRKDKDLEMFMKKIGRY